MSEARKITAYYLNGLAVATLATGGSAYLVGNVPLTTVALAGVCSAVLHWLAVRLVS
jgi:hypothetical protein